MGTPSPSGLLGGWLYTPPSATALRFSWTSGLEILHFLSRTPLGTPLSAVIQGSENGVLIKPDHPGEWNSAFLGVFSAVLPVTINCAQSCPTLCYFQNTFESAVSLDTVFQQFLLLLKFKDKKKEKMKPQQQRRLSDLLTIFQEGNLKPDSIDIELKINPSMVIGLRKTN